MPFSAVGLANYLGEVKVDFGSLFLDDGSLLINDGCRPIEFKSLLFGSLSGDLVDQEGTGK